MIREMALLSFCLGLAMSAAACTASNDQITGGENPASIGDDQKAENSPLPETGPIPALPDLGPAPEFANEVWLNTNQPLTLDHLRGKVVLVEFWTFG